MADQTFWQRLKSAHPVRMPVLCCQFATLLIVFGDVRSGCLRSCKLSRMFTARNLIGKSCSLRCLLCVARARGAAGPNAAPTPRRPLRPSHYDSRIVKRITCARKSHAHAHTHRAHNPSANACNAYKLQKGEHTTQRLRLCDCASHLYLGATRLYI